MRTRKPRETLTLGLSVFAAVAGVVGAHSYLEHRELSRHIITLEQPLRLWSSHGQAFALARFSLEQPVYLLQPGEAVRVVAKVDAKDYRAFELETADGRRGWFLAGEPGVSMVVVEHVP